jgi:alkaline phosphatase
MKNIFILFLASFTLACSASELPEPESKKPNKIIFLIGDGMGLSAVSTGFYFGDQPSVFMRFHEIGLQITSSASHKVTDSAASGTSLATGHKTYNGAVGVDTTRKPLPNIAEQLASLGWGTGVLATSTITHATPASFYAHVISRGFEEAIASQLLDSEIDFFAGGGRNKFEFRRDSVNLLALAAEKGFVIDTAGLPAPGTLKGDQKYGFLPEAGAMPSMGDGRGNFLPEATALAISHLSQNQDGFFLVVESSQIDWAGHANDAESLIGEMLDFENVIALALDYAEKDGNTLVVVTADHETGGFTLGPKTPESGLPGPADYTKLGPVFATGQHSATLIPVFAFGPGAEQFKGVYENTKIYFKMASLAGVK